MNFFKKIYGYFCCKRKPISPEEMTQLKKKRLKMLPEYSKLMVKKNNEIIV